jgi:galactokinase
MSCEPQALPLLTVIVGKKNDTDKCVVVTEAKDADKPVKVEFSVPTKEPLAPGSPKWANYIKGIVQYFKGLFQSDWIHLAQVRIS